MPRSNKNAIGKPQGVKKKKVTPVVTRSNPVEDVEYKTISYPNTVASRLDESVLQAIRAAIA